MAIAWIATRPETHLIEAFRASHWEIKVFTPFEFVPANLSRPGNVDVIVFELLDGVLLDICQEICHKRIAPMLVIVTNLAYAQAVLEAGADDFVVVPVDPIEALLRIYKLAGTSTFVHVGDLEIDLIAWRVSSGGQRVQLSPVEFRLLACLAKRVGQTVSYAEILEDVWGWDPDPRRLAQVKNCISRVRKKIDPDLHNPQYIITITREGYRLQNQRQWEENRRDIGRSGAMHSD
jgi:two-component system response regulator MtrA